MPEETRKDDFTSTTSTSPTRKPTRIIVGNYLDRAKVVQKEHKSDYHDEREFIPFLGLTLGHRHLAILLLLFTYPLLHVRQIAALLEREASSIERYLGVLRTLERRSSNRGKD